MRALLGFFKRMFGTAPTILGVQVERSTLENNNGTLSLVEKKNAFSNNIEETGVADALSIKIGDFLFFRGTDGLTFNILEVTEEYLFDELSPTTKIKGNFLQCIKDPDNGNVLFTVDNDWVNSGMQFSRVLRDNRTIFRKKKI